MPARVPSASPPLVTIGVISFNRLHYLRALLDSARECIRYPNLQWIVVDGGSREPGLREYLTEHPLLDKVAFTESGLLAEAMNRMVELTDGSCLMMLPDRVQFIARGDWMDDLVELATHHGDVGNINFDAQRRRTLERDFGPIRVRGRRVPFTSQARFGRTLTTASGREFLGYGRSAPGVNTGGIAFCRREIWHTLGPWRTTMDIQLTNDAGLGTETEMLERHAASGRRLERFLMRVPVLAPIVTDPRGTTAKIRMGNRRYGHYMAPPDGRFYYEIDELSDLERRYGGVRPAPSLEQLVNPVGFTLPLDPDGHMLKRSVINDDEPYTLVDEPSPT